MKLNKKQREALEDLENTIVCNKIPFWILKRLEKFKETLGIKPWKNENKVRAFPLTNSKIRGNMGG